MGGTCSIQGRLVLERTLKKQCVKVWTGFIWLRIGSSVGFCEYGSDPSSSTKGGEFIDDLTFSRRTLLHRVSYRYMFWYGLYSAGLCYCGNGHLRSVCMHMLVGG
jgi:hypothetical protein